MGTTLTKRFRGIEQSAAVQILKLIDLTPKQQSRTEMHLLCGLSPREIAEHEGVSRRAFYRINRY